MSKVRLKQVAQDGATDGQVATWDNSSGVWIPTTISGGVQSYGELYQDDDSGTYTIVVTPADTYSKWSNTTAGTTASGTLVTTDIGNDRLVVGSTGEGKYSVTAHSALSCSNSAAISMELRVNGTAYNQGFSTCDQKGSGQKLDLSFAGLVDLSSNDSLELWFSSDTNNTTLTFYQADLSLVRIAGLGATGATGATGAAGATGADGGVDWQGTWTSQDYTADQSVEYLGSSYICILDTTSSQVPTNATYWDVMASKGDAGGSEIDEQAASSTSTTSTTSTSYVDLNAMTITTSNTASKKYQVAFSGTLRGSKNAEATIQLVIDGAAQAATVRTTTMAGSTVFDIIGLIGLTADLANGKIIKVQWAVSAGTAYMDERCITVQGVS